MLEMQLELYELMERALCVNFVFLADVSLSKSKQSIASATLEAIDAVCWICSSPVSVKPYLVPSSPYYDVHPCAALYRAGCLQCPEQRLHILHGKVCTGKLQLLSLWVWCVF
jgi:hypothetical protein